MPRLINGVPARGHRLGKPLSARAKPLSPTASAAALASSPLPDFFIGAHAAVRGYASHARSCARFRSYFPTLEDHVAGHRIHDRQAHAASSTATARTGSSSTSAASATRSSARRARWQRCRRPGEARDAVHRDLCPRGHDPALRLRSPSLEREWFRLLQTVQGVGAQGRAGGPRHAEAGRARHRHRAAGQGDARPRARRRQEGRRAHRRRAARQGAGVSPAPTRRSCSSQADLAERPRPAARRRRRLRAGQSRLRRRSRRARRSPPRRGPHEAGSEATAEQLIRARAEGARPVSRVVARPSERDDDAPEAPLRPQLLADFVGQAQACANLKVFIDAARARKEALDHVLFVGPPGLGKTTLAQIVARELGVNFRATSGPVIAKAGDLAALLTNLEERDVLFIDEIHRLVAGGRGDPLSGDGGFPARPDHRRGAGGALGQDRPRAVHAGRRDHAARPADHAAARPLRHPGPAQFLHGRGAGAHRARAAPASSASRSPHDGAHEIARRSRGTPRIADAPAAPRARFRRRRRRRARSTPRSPTTRCRRLEVDAHGLRLARPALPRAHRRELRRRPGRHRDDRRGAVASRATRSRRSSSPS